MYVNHTVWMWRSWSWSSATVSFYHTVLFCIITTRGKPITGYCTVALLYRIHTIVLVLISMRVAISATESGAPKAVNGPHIYCRREPIMNTVRYTHHHYRWLSYRVPYDRLIDCSTTVEFNGTVPGNGYSSTTVAGAAVLALLYCTCVQYAQNGMNAQSVELIMVPGHSSSEHSCRCYDSSLDFYFHAARSYSPGDNMFSQLNCSTSHT